MVLPLILVGFAIIALAIYYWYITIPVIIIIALLWHYGTKDSDKKEDYSQSRRSQSSSYQNYSQSDYSNENGYRQSYQRKSYQRKSYHYNGNSYQNIGKAKLVRINERLEKFQITPEEARIIFGNAWTTKLGIKNRISFYFMIRRIEIKLEYDDYNRYKKKLRHLYSKLLEIIQIVNNENEDLREEEKRWGEGDYDYQNYDDSSEVNEKKITQSFQIFGLTRDSTMEQIKGKYRELSLKYHPDRNKSTDTTTKMTEINSAYEIIMEAMA
ncbi:MAG: DnaJ domain-containing protein [Nitrosopumilus sp.]